MTSSFCFYLKISTQYISSHTVYSPERIWGQQWGRASSLPGNQQRGAVAWEKRRERAEFQYWDPFLCYICDSIPWPLRILLASHKCCCISVVMGKCNSHLGNSFMMPLKSVTKVSESPSLGLGIEFLLKWHLCKTDSLLNIICSSEGQFKVLVKCNFNFDCKPFAENSPSTSILKYHLQLYIYIYAQPYVLYIVWYSWLKGRANPHLRTQCLQYILLRNGCVPTHLEKNCFILSDFGQKAFKFCFRKQNSPVLI